MVLCVRNSYTFQNICKTSLQATAGLVLERTVQCLQTVRFFGMFGRFDVRSCLFEVRSQNPRVMFKMFEVQYVQCTTDLPIKPINRPINRIGKSEKFQYRIGIGSADYNALNRLIGSSSIKAVSNEQK